MNKKLALALAVGILALAVKAEVVIYNQSYTRTYTGLGNSTVVKYSGYALIDDAGNLDQIDVVPATKTFYVNTNAAPYSVNYVRSKNGKEILVLTIPTTAYDQGIVFVKGYTSSVNTGTTLSNIAKTMTFSGSAINGSDPDAQLIEFKGAMSYNPKETTSANLAGNDIIAAIATLKAELVAKGYHAG